MKIDHEGGLSTLDSSRLVCCVFMSKILMVVLVMLSWSVMVLISVGFCPVWRVFGGRSSDWILYFGFGVGVIRLYDYLQERTVLNWTRTSCSFFCLSNFFTLIVGRSLSCYNFKKLPSGGWNFLLSSLIDIFTLLGPVLLLHISWKKKFNINARKDVFPYCVWRRTMVFYMDGFHFYEAYWRWDICSALGWKMEE